MCVIAGLIVLAVIGVAIYCLVSSYRNRIRIAQLEQKARSGGAKSSVSVIELQVGRR